MPATNQINAMETIRPMAEGVVTLAVVSAMIHTFGSMVPYVTAASGFSKSSAPSKSAGPGAELESINKRISRLRYVMDNAGEALKGTRAHREKLMREYKLYVMPSVTELIKYPKLRATELLLRNAEKNYDRMELSMMFLRKKRKELQVKLGVRAEEEGPRRTYTVMKKFREPMRREF